MIKNNYDIKKTGVPSLNFFINIKKNNGIIKFKDVIIKNNI